MPLVFVHGVRVRQDAGYQAGVDARDALFRRFALAAVCAAPERAVILNPYWGDHGARFRWNLACVPDRGAGTEGLGSGAEDPDAGPLAAALLARGGDRAGAGRLLVAAAEEDFAAGVDLLFSAGALEVGRDAAEFAELAARAATYLDGLDGKPPAWLAEVDDDEAFLGRLEEDLSAVRPAAALPGVVTPAVESLGLSDLWGAVRDGMERLNAAAGDAVGSRIYDLVREHVAPTVATFAGDVFAYLAGRGTPEEPGPVVRAVLDALHEAGGARTDDDPLVLVGHSLGGVIAYDVLTWFAPATRVDALVTVGSQVGLFEELSLFPGSDPTVPKAGAARLPRPAGAGRWINVYDENDLLSYRATPIADGVDEFRYATGELLVAHATYFHQPRFHQRLAGRLGQALGRPGGGIS